MEKDDRYEYIHPLVLWDRIKAFSDIFHYVPKSNVAEYLGKEKGRFDELIHRPYEFTFEEVNTLSALFQLPLKQMATLIEPECKKSKKEVPEQKDSKYYIVESMFKENKIKEFKDILNYIPKSVVAKDIGKKNTFDLLLERIEKFVVIDLFIIGTLCELNLAKTFSLVEAQYVKKIVPE